MKRTYIKVLNWYYNINKNGGIRRFSYKGLEMVFDFGFEIGNVSGSYNNDKTT